ncbi:MAG TPA: NAD-dependent epimerase/dehydratase family protein [Polyangiales bacterium]|nr:NAD-dependent epimerase/dehydratase family protein [Polyangiales bacterium]
MAQLNRTVALTGATGFVGRHVVERLMTEPDVRLRCLVRPKSDTGRLQAWGERVTLVRGDVCEPSTLPALLEDVWGVIHLAGYRDFWSRDRSLYYELNTRGAENVFRAALEARVEKVVQVSTPLAFGVPDEIPFDEESTPGPHPSDYARSKHLADEIGWRMHRELGLPLTVVHLAAVIGAGDPRPTMEVRRAVERRLPVLVGADTVYTYVHVRDAAEAIVRASLRPESVGRRYLIGIERATTRAYFDLIGELAGVPVPRLNVPERLLVPVAHALEKVASCTGRRPALPVDILKTTRAGSLVFDGTRAQRELGMQYTPLRVALREAVDEVLETVKDEA